MPDLVTCEFYDDLIKNEFLIVHNIFIISLWENFSMLKGMYYVTLNQIVWSGQKVNSSNILCLSSLSASLKKIQSRMKTLSQRL